MSTRKSLDCDRGSYRDSSPPHSPPPHKVQNVHYGIGTPATPDELASFYSIPPDGRGLPPGSGDATKGAQIYALACAACHGDKLEGNPAKGIGGDKLTRGPWHAGKQDAGKDRRELLALCHDAV